MDRRYPIFVPTKGRYDTLLTIRAMEQIGIPYTAVIEKQEYEQYAAVIDKKKLLVLPHQNKGLTVTRNWIWDYAQNELQAEYFWTFDDNIRGFFRYQNNLKVPVSSPRFLEAIEDFATRYENLYITGMQYHMFISRKCLHKPLSFNTRVYSNMFIKTDIPYRNELFFNDDTDLCLRILKDGHCTCLFNAFLIEKMTTMKVSGGMTPYYKQTDDRLQFVRELQAAHPDVVKLTQKWGRWQHQVDYRPFRKNKLIKKQGIEIPSTTNNYGMQLRDKETGKPLGGQDG